MNHRHVLVVAALAALGAAGCSKPQKQLMPSGFEGIRLGMSHEEMFKAAEANALMKSGKWSVVCSRGVAVSSTAASAIDGWKGLNDGNPGDCGFEVAATAGFERIYARFRGGRCTEVRIDQAGTPTAYRNAVALRTQELGPPTESKEQPGRYGMWERFAAWTVCPQKQEFSIASTFPPSAPDGSPTLLQIGVREAESGACQK